MELGGQRDKKQGRSDMVLLCPTLEPVLPDALVAASTWLKLFVVLIQGAGIAGTETTVCSFRVKSKPHPEHPRLMPSQTYRPCHGAPAILPKMRTSNCLSSLTRRSAQN